MALIIVKETKHPTTPVPEEVVVTGAQDQVASPPPEIVEKVAKLLELQAIVSDILADPRIKALAALKEDVKKYVDAATQEGVFVPNLPVILTTDVGHATYSPCAQKREVVDKEALLMKVGEDTFLALANFKLGDLDKILDQEEQAGIISVEPHGGVRSLAEMNYLPK